MFLKINPMVNLIFQMEHFTRGSSTTKENSMEMECCFIQMARYVTLVVGKTIVFMALEYFITSHLNKTSNLHSIGTSISLHQIRTTTKDSLTWITSKVLVHYT